jgi:hypothetical protein
MQQCARCGRARYCDKQCQKDNWKHHKKLCEQGLVKTKHEVFACNGDKHKIRNLMKKIPTLPIGDHHIQCVGGCPAILKKECLFIYAVTSDGIIWKLPWCNFNWVEYFVAASLFDSTGLFQKDEIFPRIFTMSPNGMLSCDDSDLEIPWYKSALMIS